MPSHPACRSLKRGEIAAALNLAIDGRDASVTNALGLYQADPYPGGHRYEVRIRGARGWLWNELESAKDPEAVDQRSILCAFESIASAALGAKTSTAEFALNSVETVEVMQDEIALTGLCSPIVAY